MNYYGINFTPRALTQSEIYEGEQRIAKHLERHGMVGTPTMSQMEEAIFTQDVHRDTDIIVEKMTYKEQTQLAYVPLILSELAWIYADKVCELAKQYKIQETKPLVRKVAELKTEYLSMIKKDLNQAHIDKYVNDAHRFLEKFAYDFTIFFYTVNGEVKRVAPNLKYYDLISMAIIAVLLVRMLAEHNVQLNKLLLDKLGEGKGSVTNPYLFRLQTLMDAATCNCMNKIDLNGQIGMCMKIFKNNLSRVELQPSDEKQ